MQNFEPNVEKGVRAMELAVCFKNYMDPSSWRFVDPEWRRDPINGLSVSVTRTGGDGYFRHRICLNDVPLEDGNSGPMTFEEAKASAWPSFLTEFFGTVKHIDESPQVS